MVARRIGLLSRKCPVTDTSAMLADWANASLNASSTRAAATCRSCCAVSVLVSFLSDGSPVAVALGQWVGRCSSPGSPRSRSTMPRASEVTTTCRPRAVSAESTATSNASGSSIHERCPELVGGCLTGVPVPEPDLEELHGFSLGTHPRSRQRFLPTIPVAATYTSEALAPTSSAGLRTSAPGPPSLGSGLVTAGNVVRCNSSRSDQARRTSSTSRARSACFGVIPDVDVIALRERLDADDPEPP